ncbi:hypothetical protein Tco_0290766, partial [Tanacetum coccineum]
IVVANSTTEAEYVAAANCLFHSKTKHIEIRHHFIRDSYEKKLIQVIKIHTDHNVLDLLTKAFDVRRLDERDAFKHRRKIVDLDADAELTLVDETQEMNDDNLIVAAPVTTADEVVATANVKVTTANAPTTTIDELTLPQTLIEIKAAKPKAVKSAATTTTTTIPKAKGVVVQEPSEFKTTSSPLQASQLPQAKDKGKAKMVEPEKPFKKKDQIAMDKEVARNLEAQLQAKLEEEERISRLKEEKANIDLLETWDNTQAMMDADFQLA